MNKAIFIDRDGVINKWTEPEDKDYGPNWYCLKWEDFEFLPGVFEAFGLLAQSAKYVPIVVSNQSCIGKGYIENDCINDIFYNMSLTITRKISGFYPIDYYYCPHDTNENCACRKPQPGMLYKAAIEHDIDLSQSWMIGDSYTDIEAGYNAGVPNLIRIDPETNWDSYTVSHPNDIAENTFVKVEPSLLEAVKFILKT